MRHALILVLLCAAPFTAATAEVAATLSSCDYSLSTNFGNFQAGADKVGTITLTTGVGCPWSVSGIPNWVTSITPVSGQGSATLSFKTLSFTPDVVINQYHGLPRTGSITIGTQIARFTQPDSNLPQDYSKPYGSGSVIFPDVALDMQQPFSWYNNIVLMLARAITHGCADDGSFCPNREITRGELAVFVVRSKLYPRGEPSPNEILTDKDFV